MCTAGDPLSWRHLPITCIEQRDAETSATCEADCAKRSLLASTHFRIGAEVGALARRRFIEGKLDAWDMEAWVRLAMPVHTRARQDPQALQAAPLDLHRADVNLSFARPGGEGRTFDFFPALSSIQCPTLVLGGEADPMIPIECQEDLVAALPSHLVPFERFPNCGHSVIADAPVCDVRDYPRFIAH